MLDSRNAEMELCAVDNDGATARGAELGSLLDVDRALGVSSVFLTSVAGVLFGEGALGSTPFLRRNASLPALWWDVSAILSKGGWSIL